MSFTNIKPVADAGTNQSVFVGEEVLLDGSGSSDVNGDAITYRWTLASRPAASASTISDATAAHARLVPVRSATPTSRTRTCKINVIIELVQRGSYAEAIDKLEQDAIPKTDGCAAAGAVDHNDWITNCGAQGSVHPLLTEALRLLRNL